MPRPFEVFVKPLLASLALTTAVAATFGACAGNTDCGPGTQRKQLANGDTICTAVDVAAGSVSCDGDGGVHLVAGNQCVATNVQCGPGTVLDAATGQCLPIARAAHEPDACPTVASGKICVNGTVRNFIDGSFLSSQTVDVAVYDPLAFLGGGNAMPLDHKSVTDIFTFPSLAAPSTGYVLVATSDPSGGTMYAKVAIGGLTQSGQATRVDAYVITAAQLAAWSSGAGADYKTSGALLYRMFSDKPPPGNDRTPTETHPLAGVQLIDTNTMSPPPMLKYFGATMMAIDGALTSTGASGGAIVVGSGVASFTAKGGGIPTWETHQALPIVGMVQIDALHPQQ